MWSRDFRLEGGSHEHAWNPCRGAAPKRAILIQHRVLAQTQGSPQGEAAEKILYKRVLVGHRLGHWSAFGVSTSAVDDMSI